MPDKVDWSQIQRNAAEFVVTRFHVNYNFLNVYY